MAWQCPDCGLALLKVVKDKRHTQAGKAVFVCASCGYRHELKQLAMFPLPTLPLFDVNPTEETNDGKVLGNC